MRRRTRPGCRRRASSPCPARSHRDDVVLEVVDRCLPGRDERGNDVAAHVVIGIRVLGVGTDGIDEHLGGEDVVAHRRERHGGVVRRSGRVRRLLEELGDVARGVAVDAAECRCLGARYADAGHRDTGTGIDVLLHHLLGVHAVHVVRTEHDDVLGILVVHEVHGLEDGVGTAGVPAGPEPLLRGHGGDVLTRETRQPPGLGDVPVERVRLVLGQNAQPQIAGVDEIAQHEVDQAVRTTERDRGLRAIGCHRIQAFALTSGEHDSEYMRLGPHNSQPIRL